MPLISIFGWSQFQLPTTLSTTTLETRTYPNDPAQPKYDPAAESWIGADFTFLGGASTPVDILDDDTMFEDGYVETGGMQTLAAPVTVNGITYPAGSVIENEFSLTDSLGTEVYVVRINGVNVGFAYATGQQPTAGDVFTAAEGRDGAPADNADGTSSSSEPYAGVICFAGGTLIDTADGPRRADALRPGDKVCTRDRGVQELIWVGHRRVTVNRQDLSTLPVRIAAGSMGEGLPLRDLVVSPQHQMLMSGVDVFAAFGQREVLAPAKGLLDLPGVTQADDRREILYVHLLLDHHALLLAEGALAESFYPGLTALQMMPHEQATQVRQLLASISENVPGGFGGPVRPRLTCRQTRKLARQRANMACSTRRMYHQADRVTSESHPVTP